MARSKSGLSAIIIAVLAIALLYVLNPTTDDFKAWESRQGSGQAKASSSSGLDGVLKKGADIAGAIKGGVKGAIAGLYSRQDYYLCSTYSLGDNLYLGIAKVFLKLK